MQGKGMEKSRGIQVISHRLFSLLTTEKEISETQHQDPY